jgi:hypothetical protein
MTMDVDYGRLEGAVAATVRALEAGPKAPTRRPYVQIAVVRDLQGEVAAGHCNLSRPFGHSRTPWPSTPRRRSL